MNPTNRRILALWVVLQFLVPAFTHAQVKFGTLPAADANLDLAVPETPAFYALGLTPEAVSRPASPRELVSSQFIFPFASQFRLPVNEAGKGFAG